MKRNQHSLVICVVICVCAHRTPAAHDNTSPSPWIVLLLPGTLWFGSSPHQPSVRLMPDRQAALFGHVAFNDGGGIAFFRKQSGAAFANRVFPAATKTHAK